MGRALVDHSPDGIDNGAGRPNLPAFRIFDRWNNKEMAEQFVCAVDQVNIHPFNYKVDTTANGLHYACRNNDHGPGAENTSRNGLARSPRPFPMRRRVSCCIQSEVTMRVLVLDIGGTHVKVYATGHRKPVKIVSGAAMTPKKMVKDVLAL